MSIGETLKHAQFGQQMEILCREMPCLRGVKGAVPWVPELLAEQWEGGTELERAAIVFVLSVWGPETTWGRAEAFTIPSFTLSDFEMLDDDNKKAVAAWFAAPFWP